MPDDYSADRFTTGTVAVGGSTTGTIETAYDEDWFAVELVAGRTYQFDLEGSPTGRGTLPDTYLRAIYDSEGRYQSRTYNDNFDGSKNSRVTFTAEESGTYYVRASGDRDEVGDYTLSVRDMTPPEAGNPPPADPPAADPPADTAAAVAESETDQGQAVPGSVSEGATDLPNDASTPGRVAVGDTATGTIGTAREEDWFAVELVAGRTYVIDLRGSPTDDGTLSDPYLRGIHDAGGNRIANTTNDDGGQGYNSRVTFTATESGTHYIAAGAWSSRQGTYELEVTDTSPPMVGPDEDSGDPPDRQEQVQQQPPAFGSQFYGFELEENADGSVARLSLGAVSATDPDGGSVSYGIEGGNESGRFEIDAASGELFYVGAGEDYETGSTRFELTVRASDGDETTDTSVTVNVTDVDEPVVVDPPVTQPDQSTPQTVSEPAGEDFSRALSTSGRVAVGDTATGRIGSSGDRDWFAVELAAGRTYVIDLRGSPTDDGTLSDPYLRGIYDADGNRISNTTNDDGGRGYNSRLTFTATESGTHYIAAGAWSSRRGTYEVEVTDTSPPETPQEQVQQQPPAFDRQAHLFELEENADGSTDRLSLGAVSATDPDGGSVSYGIEGGNESGRFEIDAASGELFYVGGGEDYETGSTRFELTVRASDGEQTTDATVTVNVTDVAEAPSFAQAGYTFALAENADGSVARLSLGTVSATDPDGGSVSYGIEGGNESGRFEIDAASGELFYVAGARTTRPVPRASS